MKINGKYYNVNWDDFRKACKEKAPEGHKFEKNEVKNIYKSVVGSAKHKRKEKLANSH
tara:strand:+ start:587 stop:760 length:174 start_codon:yes stop_codon:yes gene_type:complete